MMERNNDWQITALGVPKDYIHITHQGRRLHSHYITLH